MTAFTNTLAISLFALIPGHKLGITTLVVAIVGIVFVTAALLSLLRVRTRRWQDLRDALFVTWLLGTFVYPGGRGSHSDRAFKRFGRCPHDRRPGRRLLPDRDLAVVELVDGPSIRITHELGALLKPPKNR